MVRLSSLYYLYSCLNGKIVAAKECLYEKQEQFNDMKSELEIMTRLNAASIIQVYGYSLFNHRKVCLCLFKIKVSWEFHRGAVVNESD